jgi:hypothetical protein
VERHDVGRRRLVLRRRGGGHQRRGLHHQSAGNRLLYCAGDRAEERSGDRGCPGAIGAGCVLVPGTCSTAGGR